MDLLAAYASSDDEASSTTKVTTLAVVNSTPDVLVPLRKTELLAANAKVLTLNQPIAATSARVLGPQNPFQRHAPVQVGAGREIVTGVVERTEMEDFCFDEEYNQQQFRHAGPPQPKRPKTKACATYQKDVGSEAEHGIWAPFSKENMFWVPSDKERGTMTEAQKELLAENEAKKASRNREEEADMDFDRMIERKVAHLLPPRLAAGATAMEPKTAYLDEEEFDYQGRSWVDQYPRDLKPGEHKVYLPKKPLFQFEGHTKGVQAIELIPKYGHLCLSGSLDGTVRIWDMNNEHKCKRIYQGHKDAVRAINFAPDGKTFLTASFDRYLRLWDTETGQVKHTFTNRRVPYCIKFHPDESDQFVIGDSNHMIVQFDVRSGGTMPSLHRLGDHHSTLVEIVQEYNHHLQTVNAVTFVDDNRRFVSTSDDKKILIWEWGIPVPIKYVSEPGMHSMPSTTLHPSGSYFAGQCLSNQIDVYTARDKFKLQRKKVFRGHSCSGYACQVNFSPNGQYVVSGDGEGHVAFWDWKTTKMYKKMKAHNGPTMGVAWHPIEPSRVVTCGWDGLIKCWD
ncbi:hypothetical protein H310_14715 [Aphanomyces invadans]|uniref:Pre-mRNA-processing factor 17 n=1 Tax=Aphanomyces invadans TaxID=157072 RepID=A0A024TA79_9STRA|nr:hypothetical protein H310_14715 [Aphanomyces invadans]ETV90526.1 hypothetical protein H310_14715 [Aphanomyces invadans]|eukprot:XP_008880842.1 hypothetical protein H310_14715 [Aphanomyces invadans]